MQKHKLGKDTSAEMVLSHVLYCFTGTKVHILTHNRQLKVKESGEELVARVCSVLAQSSAENKGKLEVRSLLALLVHKYTY